MLYLYVKVILMYITDNFYPQQMSGIVNNNEFGNICGLFSYITHCKQLCIFIKWIFLQEI